MKIVINHNESDIEARKITIVNGDIEYDININQFAELVINKQNFGKGDSAIIIKPTTSNEVRLT